MATFAFDTVIDRLGTGSSKWSRHPSDVLPMWVADMDFAAPPAVVAALQDRLAHQVLGYAVAQDGLRETIVAAMAQRYGWTIAPEDLVFLPGVEPGFNMALRAQLQPGDGVTVQTPMYRPILSAPGHWGLVRHDVPLVPGERRHGLDVDALSAALDRSKAFLFCHPHNPTGRTFDRADLEAIAEACLVRDVAIISDEIHCDLLFDGRRHVPLASLSPEVARRTITLMAASKTYNIAGLKTAFAIIPDPDLRARFAACRLGMVDSVNALGLVATQAAFRDCEPWRQALLAYLGANRDHLMRELARRFPTIRCIAPEATFLAWLDCAALGLPDPQAFFLEKGRVGFSAGHEFGTPYGQHVRLNFGCPRALLDEGLDRMERALAGR
ncbi:MalY/PatB family protein [uncultured Alsobacter sp.]|uniref:MalY/PatB family protein n=1 Tax=uncultured Alsobacter sp. TaxID=1748258 RepID=UPI0025DABA7F|nr:PatB family C-S lyase [uncultured Alsobacter sp.]